VPYDKAYSKTHQPTVRGSSQQNAQWIWPGPVTDKTIIVCVWAITESYNVSPYLPPQCSCNHYHLRLLLHFSSRAVQRPPLRTWVVHWLARFKVFLILGSFTIKVWGKCDHWHQDVCLSVFISACNHSRAAEQIQFDFAELQLCRSIAVLVKIGNSNCYTEDVKCWKEFLTELAGISFSTRTLRCIVACNGRTWTRLRARWCTQKLHSTGFCSKVT
jgi:hypothetical protein